MPFTPSHVAAVLPLRGRMGLPFAALAAGAMSPDLDYFLPFSLSRSATHSAWSIPTWDLLFGVVMWLTWRWAAPALRDISPQPIRERWRPAPPAQGGWWLVLLAIMIGSATHVLWDSVTHAGTYFSRLAPLAAIYPSPIGGLFGYRYLQYVSGAVGLAIVAWAGFRQPVRDTEPRRQPHTAAIAPALFFAGALLGVAVRTAVLDAPPDRRSLVFASVTSSISGAGLALILVCVFHTIVEHQRRAASLERNNHGG